MHCCACEGAVDLGPSTHQQIPRVPLHRVSRWRQQGRQGAACGQGLAAAGQVRQQPVDGGGTAGATGIELADSIAGKAQLLFEQLLGLGGNRTGKAHAGGAAGDQFGSGGESRGPV